MKYKLNIELVPDGCWYSNLRTLLSKEQWDFIRKDVKERSGGRCMICGKQTTRLDAHERWRYDEENAVQILDDILAVCKDCHGVIHFGFTQLKSKNIEHYENHFMKVNGCNYAQFREALNQANIDHVRRNQVSEWKINLNYLKRYIREDRS